MVYSEFAFGIFLNVISRSTKGIGIVVGASFLVCIYCHWAVSLITLGLKSWLNKSGLWSLYILVIFSTTTCISFTKLNLRRSIWGAEQIQIIIGSKVMTQNKMQVKKSLSFAEQSVFVSSIPSSMHSSENENSVSMVWTKGHRIRSHPSLTDIWFKA